MTPRWPQRGWRSRPALPAEGPNPAGDPVLLDRLAAAEAKLKSLEGLDSRIARLESGLRELRGFAARAFWHAMDRDDADASPSRPATCPVCDRSAPRDALECLTSDCIFGGGRLERHRCAGCGCIFGASKFLGLPDALVDLDYRILYADYAESNTTASEIRAFRALDPSPGATYVNWGAGRWNDTIGQLRADGFDVLGYEPSPSSEPVPFVTSDRGAIPLPVRGIFSNNVIEHLLRPLEEFRTFHAMLAPGGRMAHATACYRYLYEFTRFHVVFLTGDSPHVLAERTGFRVVERIEDGEFICCVFEKR